MCIFELGFENEYFHLKARCFRIVHLRKYTLNLSSCLIRLLLLFLIVIVILIAITGFNQ